MDITDSQIVVLSVYSLCLGVFLGICYFVFTFVRLVLTPSFAAGVRRQFYSDVVIFVFDIAYALFSSCCVALLFFGANNGRIRLLGLGGCALGFALWHFIAGRGLIRAARKLVYLVRRILKKIFMHTAVPVFRFVTEPFQWVWHDTKTDIAKRKEQSKKKKKTKKKKETGNDAFSI